jgi:RHS repeat-associated protein
MMAVVTDTKVAVRMDNASVSYYLAHVISATDYYAFGSPVPGRSFNLTAYRYGFNGMELDNEISGGGSSYYTEFRQYDPRLSRWFSVDPILQPWMSPYCAMDNNPISFVDPFGLIAQGEGGVEGDGEVSQKRYRTKEVKVSANVVKYKNYKEFKYRREHLNRTQNYEKFGTSRKDWKAYLNKTYGTERVNAARNAFLAEQHRNSSSWSTSSTMMASLAISMPASGGVTTPVVAAVGITVGVAALGVAIYQSITYNPDEIFDNLPDYVGKDETVDNAPPLPLTIPLDDAVPNPGGGDNDTRYLHYTDAKGAAGIAASNQILPNSKGKVYLTTSVMNAAEVFQNIFIGAQDYVSKGNYVVVFTLTPDQEANISPSQSDPYELIHDGKIKLRRGIIYVGPNPFK